MRYCPKCKTEYEDRIEFCADCQDKLVSQLPKETARDNQQQKSQAFATQKLLIKGAGIGVTIFVLGEVIIYNYAHLCMKLFNGKGWSPLGAIMFPIVNILQLFFHFSAKIFLALGGNNLINPDIKFTIYPLLILRGIDLIAWIGLSILILLILDRKSKSRGR